MIEKRIQKKTYSDEEQKCMYKINQGHLTVFCIVFVCLGGPPSPVGIITQVQRFMYQNRLGPSGGIYYPNFVPCFVVLYLNLDLRAQVHPGEPWVSKQRVHIVLKASKSAVAKGDVPKICGFVHPLHPL